MIESIVTYSPDASPMQAEPNARYGLSSDWAMLIILRMSPGTPADTSELQRNVEMISDVRAPVGLFSSFSCFSTARRDVAGMLQDWPQNPHTFIRQGYSGHSYYPEGT